MTDKKTLTAWARIEFLSPDEGGRKIPPERRFAAPARFFQSDDCWTLLATFDHPLDENRRTTTAFIDFLADEAPHEFLVAEAQFEWLEGARVVARGQVITNSKRVPTSSTVDSDEVKREVRRDAEKVA